MGGADAALDEVVDGVANGTGTWREIRARAERQPGLELGPGRVRDSDRDRQDSGVERGVAEYALHLRALDIPGRRKRHGAAAHEQCAHCSTGDGAEEVKVSLLEVEVDRVSFQHEILHFCDAIAAWGQTPQLIEHRLVVICDPPGGTLPA